MDDLTQKLDRLLASPDGMKRIEDMMSTLGVAAPAADTASPAPAFGDVGMLLKLMPLLSRLGQKDEGDALLEALRPHLQQERQKRLDDAGQILRLIKLLPLLEGLGKGGDGI